MSNIVNAPIDMYVGNNNVSLDRESTVTVAGLERDRPYSVWELASRSVARICEVI